MSYFLAVVSLNHKYALQRGQDSFQMVMDLKTVSRHLCYRDIWNQSVQICNQRPYFTICCEDPPPPQKKVHIYLQYVSTFDINVVIY